MLLAVQAGTTAAAAALSALLNLHAETPTVAALVSYAALAAVWARLTLALNSQTVPARDLFLIGITLVLAYSLSYMTIPAAFTDARPAPTHFVGAHRLVDALYFSTTTATTVGYGDRVPVTTFARILVMSQYAAAACIAVLIANHFS